MEFVNAGGYGLLEEQTGLPINMRRIRCPKANGSIGAMRLEAVATEFYRENCGGCELRKPTGELPTLAAFVEDQDAELRAAEEAKRVRVASARSAWDVRVNARGARIVTSDPAMTQAIHDLDAIDPDPKEDANREAAKDAIRRLQKLADRAPQTYSTEVVELMFNILVVDASSGLFEPLRTLAQHRADIQSRLTLQAIRVLTDRPYEEAARVLVQHAEDIAPGQLDRDVVRNLVLASYAPQHSQFGQLGPRRTTNPAALALAADRAPEVLVPVLQEMLPGPYVATELLLPPGTLGDADDSMAEFARGAAAAATAQLAETHPRLATRLIPALIRNCVVPKDRYAGYPAAQVAQTLALLLLRGHGDVARALESAGRNASDDDREQLFEVWQKFAHFAFERRHRDEARNPVLSPEEQLAVKNRVIDEAAKRFNGSWGADVAFHAGVLIEELAQQDPSWALSKCDVLLGGVLVAYQAMDATPQNTLATPQAPNPMLSAMEAYSRRQAFNSAAYRLLRAIQAAAAADANRIVASIETFMTVERDANIELQLRWSFIPVLGEIGAARGNDVGLLARVLPILSTYLVDPSHGLAARAIDAWCMIQRRHIVPTTLEDLLPVLLENETIVVAKAVMEGIPGLRMSRASTFTLLQRAVGLCQGLTPQDDTDLLKACIIATCILAREFPAVQLAAELVALNRAAELDGYDLERVLDLRWSADTRRSESMARLRLRQVADPAINDPYNQNEDRQLVQLLGTGRGLAALTVSDLTAVAVSFGPEAAVRGLEIAEVAWRAGRPGDAIEIIASVRQIVPDTPAYGHQRRLIAAVEHALRQEVTEESRSPGQDEDSDELEPIAKIEAQAQARLQLRELLVARSGSSLDSDAAVVRAKSLDHLAKLLNAQAQRATPTAAYVRSLAALATLAARLLRRDQAEHGGDVPTIAAATRSAQRGEQELRRLVSASFDGSDPLAGRLLASLDGITTSVEEGRLEELLASWAQLEMPLVIVEGAPLSRARTTRSSGETVETTPTAVVLVSIDGNLLTGPAVLAPDTVYEISVEVQPDDWPDWATSLDLEFVGALGPREVLLPALSWSRPSKQPSTLEGAGTLVLRYRLPSGRPAAPFAVRVHWRGQVKGQPKSRALDVAGHSQIRVRPYDASLDALTSYPSIDARLLRLFAKLPDAHYRDDEIQAFCRMFTSICREAFRLTWDRRYRKGQRVTERMFHDELFDRLMADPDLGGRVERGTRLALGFLDIRHDGITAELKVERAVAVTRESAPKYMGQPTQYAAADGRRLSILVILDMSPKELPPGTPENYIFELHPAQHGMTNPEAPSMVSTIVVNGNMPAPSSWSRRKRGNATRP